MKAESIHASTPRLARGAAVAVMSTALFSSSAAAQSRFEFTRSLALVQAYDDNLFAQPSDEQEDFISRLSARVGVGHLSRRLTLRARYALDAEAYRQHRELDTPTAFQEGALDLEWTPARKTSLAAAGAYAEAQTSAQLNTLTGLDVGRFPSRRFGTAASLSQLLGPRTTVTATHTFNHEQVDQGPESNTQAVSLGLKQRMGPIGLGRLTFRAERFFFGSDVISSQVVTLGWSRELTRFARLELDAGPRRSGHTVEPEVSAGLSHRFRRGAASLSYLRTQTTVIGQPGPVAADGVSAIFSRRLGRVQLGCGPAYFRVHGQGLDSTVRRLNLDVGWRLTRQLSLAASHLFSFQRGGLGLDAGPNAEMSHNVFVVSLVAGAKTN